MVERSVEWSLPRLCSAGVHIDSARGHRLYAQLIRDCVRAGLPLTRPRPLSGPLSLSLFPRESPREIDDSSPGQQCLHAPFLSLFCALAPSAFESGAPFNVSARALALWLLDFTSFEILLFLGFFFLFFFCFCPGRVVRAPFFYLIVDRLIWLWDFFLGGVVIVMVGIRRLVRFIFLWLAIEFCVWSDSCWIYGQCVI